jgi:uncharacterized protein
MRILMTGATGLIGRALGLALAERGDTLVCLVRDVAAARQRLPFPAQCHAWSHDRPVPTEALQGVQAVVHLAGEPVADSRWTPQKKVLVRDTRVLGTRALVQAVLQHGPQVATFVHGSALGIYGDRGDERLNAASPKGRGFLSDLVLAWEAELRPLAQARPALRLPVVRTGVVLSAEGGALTELLPIARLGGLGRLGRGHAWLGWIHEHDIVRLFLHALDQAPTGVLEGVAPQPATNAEFTAALCQALGVREGPPVPPLALKALYGERADVLLASTRLLPQATQASGFAWRFSQVDEALANLLQPLRGGLQQRRWAQWLPHPPEALWPFFCEARNLEAITPPWLGFQVLRQSTPAIGAGTLIDYRLSLHGLPLRWQTRIATWEPPHRFVDRQLRGPYASWQHTHDFVPLAGGTVMRDTLQYQLPAGRLGRAAAGRLVAGDVARIFAYRAQVIADRFGAAPA